MLSVLELIKLVRTSVNVQIPEYDEHGKLVQTTDSGYLVMTDEDIELYLKLGLTRAFPECDSLTELPEGAETALVLLAKAELYRILAVYRADKVDMGADNNNYLKQDQRFQHYMKLAQDAEEQYEEWLENESNGHNTVSSYDVLLSNRHYTNRNYEKQVKPIVRVYVDEVTSDSVKFHWKVTNTSHFGRFKVFIDTKPILDIYKEGSMTYADKVSSSAKVLKSTGNIRDTYHGVKGLTPDTKYHLAVVSVERNQVFGYVETTFTTIEKLADEEDVSIDTI